MVNSGSKWCGKPGGPVPQQASRKFSWVVVRSREIDLETPEFVWIQSPCLCESQKDSVCFFLLSNEFSPLSTAQLLLKRSATSQGGCGRHGGACVEASGCHTAALSLAPMVTPIPAPAHESKESQRYILCRNPATAGVQTSSTRVWWVTISRGVIRTFSQRIVAFCSALSGGLPAPDSECPSVWSGSECACVWECACVCVCACVSVSVVEVVFAENIEGQVY